MVNFVSQVLALATIASQAGLALFFSAWLFLRRTRLFQVLLGFLGRNALFFSLLLSLAGVFVSLFYSEIAGLVPCSLCWFQRVFLYPQVLIFGLARRKKDEKALDYGLTLSLFGAGFALYQIYLQIANQTSVLCSSIGALADCSQRSFLSFGYVDLPVMSLTAFLLLIVLALAGKLTKK